MTVQTLPYPESIKAWAQRSAATVISPCRLSDLSKRELLACVQGSTALISAKMVFPCCPTWLISQTRASLPAVADVPVPPSVTDAIFTTTCQTEKLAALGELAAGVAHELGNPLSIISSSLQYLHQRLAAANDSASDFTMMALQNVERMSGLLQTMLHFVGVKKPRIEQVDLKEMISEVLRFTSAECIRRSIIVDAAFDPALPKAWVDPCGFKQIILNLVKNSLDALAQEGTTLHLRTSMDPNRQAVVEIENNGPAIPADVMAKIFSPFHTTKVGGTGLGLYLSRQIARDQGGDLEAENLQGAVRFTLTLPLDRRIDKMRGENGAHPDR
jgi:signal transduction histidine kinase